MKEKSEASLNFLFEAYGNRMLISLYNRELYPHLKLFEISFTREIFKQEFFGPPTPLNMSETNRQKRLVFPKAYVSQPASSGKM